MSIYGVLNFCVVRVVLEYIKTGEEMRFQNILLDFGLVRYRSIENAWLAAFDIGTDDCEW